MDGRSSVVFAAFALLTTALAGCIDNPLTAASADGEVPALEHRGLADNAASSWAPGAQLVSIFSLESAFDNEPIPADPTPGNGEAPIWYYAYVSPAGDARAFRVLADGQVFIENESYGAEAYSGHATPLGDLAVDSDDGLQAAAKDKVFAEALSGDGLTVAEGVAHWDGMTGWYFAAISDKASALAVVDAGSGTLLWVTPFDMDFDMDFGGFANNGFAYRPDAEPLDVTSEGRLDRGTAEAEIPFTYEGLTDQAFLEIVAMSEVLTDRLSWTLLDSEGEKVDGGSVGMRSFGGSQAQRWTGELELDGPGAYTLLLTYKPATPVGPGGVTYELHLTDEVEDEDEE